MSQVAGYLLLALLVWGAMVQPVLYVLYRRWRRARYRRREVQALIGDPLIDEIRRSYEPPRPLRLVKRG